MEEPTQSPDEAFEIDQERLRLVTRQFIAQGYSDIGIVKEINKDIERRKRGEPFPFQKELFDLDEEF